MAEEVLPSLYRIVVPLPGNPLKEVNSYVLTAPDRNLVIDTGMNRPECLNALVAGLDEIGIDLDQTDFLATHLHADHHGLIPKLLRPGRRAFMGAIDAGHMSHGFGWSTDSPMGRYMARSGFPHDDLVASFQNHPGFKFRPDRVVHYEPLHEGDTIEIGHYRLRVIDTPGHTSGHISLFDPEQRLFIAGDHVLGDITPNIQAWSDDEDPLADYLDSLEKVEAGGEMEPDAIFLWENCDVGAWVLHAPSLALGPGGTAMVGYQARDISGGWDNPDPTTMHDCVAGTDMTWSRVAKMK